MSSKALSYYDWSKGFKKSSVNHDSNEAQLSVEDRNSIGIPDNQFKSYIKKWKEENLSE